MCEDIKKLAEIVDALAGEMEMLASDCEDTTEHYFEKEVFRFRMTSIQKIRAELDTLLQA